MSPRVLNKLVWEYWPLIASYYEQIHDPHNVQYQKIVFHAAFFLHLSNIVIVMIKLDVGFTRYPNILYTEIE